MATRRSAREWAVQILFQLDLNQNGGDSLQTVFDEFWANQLRLKLEEGSETPDEGTFTGSWRDRIADKRIRKFTERMVADVRENLEVIDAAIIKYAHNWDLDRMGGIERNVLRMGACELLFRAANVPPAVVINEAVDVAKFFGMRESGRFVNGILDRIAKERSNDGLPSREWSPAADE